MTSSDNAGSNAFDGVTGGKVLSPKGSNANVGVYRKLSSSRKLLSIVVGVAGLLNALPMLFFVLGTKETAITFGSNFVLFDSEANGYINNSLIIVMVGLGAYVIVAALADTPAPMTKAVLAIVSVSIFAAFIVVSNIRMESYDSQMSEKAPAWLQENYDVQLAEGEILSLEEENSLTDSEGSKYIGTFSMQDDMNDDGKYIFTLLKVVEPK